MSQLLTRIIGRLIHKNKIGLLKSIQYLIIIKIIFGMCNLDNIINYYYYYLIYVYIYIVILNNIYYFIILVYFFLYYLIII
jgi:hypothetical protein